MDNAVYTLTAASDPVEVGTYLSDDEVMSIHFRLQAEAFHLADEITEDFDSLCIQLCRRHHSGLWEVLTDCL